MITVFGEGRGFRVVWLLEEMGARKRAMNTCHATRTWAAAVAGRRDARAGDT